MVHYISFIVSIGHCQTLIIHQILSLMYMVEPLRSCFTDTSNDTTNLTLLCTPSLSVTTGLTSITDTSSFQYIVLISYPLSNSSCGYSTNNNNGFYCC